MSSLSAEPPPTLSAAELRRWMDWYIKLRWFVPLAMLAAASGAWLVGYRFNWMAVACLAGIVLAYNLALFFGGGRGAAEEPSYGSLRGLATAQIGLDYAAMLGLLHWTGGAAHPLAFFFVLHILLAALVLRPRWAWGCAVAALAGMGLLEAVELAGWLTPAPVHFRESWLLPMEEGGRHLFLLSAIGLALFGAAASATYIVRTLDERLQAVWRAANQARRLSDRLEALYQMIESIGTKQQMIDILQPACQRLTELMKIKAISVKLLEPDGRHLRYAAACGLPPQLAQGQKIDLELSPLNRRVVEGDPFVTGDLSRQEMFQFGEDLEAVGLRSVIFVPLRSEGRVIGILGGYCTRPNRFQPEDISFFQQAADLVAMFLENSRAMENVHRLMEEKTRFMARVAHNLRAPLDASLSMLNVLREDYVGSLNQEQKEYLRRVHRRLDTMHNMINELMALSRSRAGEPERRRQAVDWNALAGRVQRSFQEEARGKGLDFQVVVEPRLPPTMGDPDLLEQVLENLVSNAVKYTQQGKIRLHIRPGAASVEIEVSDTGIGIPQNEQKMLFTEFFRASNARRLDEIGTGLGLAIVQQIVGTHAGKIDIESREGAGTRVSITLPAEGREEGGT